MLIITVHLFPLLCFSPSHLVPESFSRRASSLLTLEFKHFILDQWIPKKTETQPDSSVHTVGDAGCAEQFHCSSIGNSAGPVSCS